MGWLTYALVFAGMALYWPMLRRNALFYSLAGHDGTPLEAVGWYTVFLLLVACVVGLCVRRGSVSFRRLTPGLALAFGAQALCKLLEVVWHPGGVAAVLLALVGVGGFAVVLVALTCLWASTCVALDRRTAALMATASFAGSFLVKEVWGIPGVMGIVLTSATPLVSLALWYGADRCSHGRQGGEIDAGDTPFPRALIAILAVFLVAGGIVRGVFYNSLNGSSVATNLPQDVLTVGLALALLAAFVLWNRGSKLVQLSWSIGALLVFGGLLLMVAMGGEGQRAGGELVVVGRTCLGLVFWIMLADLVRSGGYSLMGTFGAVFLMVEVLSSFLGYVAVPEVMKLLDIATTNAVTVLLTVIAFALIVAMMIFFNRTRPEVAAGLPGPEGARPPLDLDFADEASVLPASTVSPTELFAAAGLTDREAEVAALLAAGNSQKKISEVLSVSIGTVQSHIKAIYRKFDIHSRQEFIDALRQERV